MAKTVHTRHTVSGQVGDVHENIYNHPVLGRYLERVDEGTKPYQPEMHVPREADDEEDSVVYPSKDGDVAVSIEDDVAAYDEFIADYDKDEK